MKRWLGVLLSLSLMGAVATAGPMKADAAAETVVVFQLGSRTYTVDGTQYEMDVAPRADPDTQRTLLPVRFAAQAMNASVFWNEEGQRITVVHNDTHRVLELAIGEPTMQVGTEGADAEVVTLDQAPVADPPGRTMLPIRAVAEALYGQVSWDPGTQRITIVRPPNHDPGVDPAAPELDFGSMLPMDHENMDTHGDEVKQVPITNRGQGRLYVDAAGFEKQGAFTLCGQRFEPFVLAPGESRSIMVCVVAREAGQYQESMQFRSRVEIPTDKLLTTMRIKIWILGCTVRIDGGGLRPNIATTGIMPLGAAGWDAPVVNVGQAMDLHATVSGLFGPYTYQWTVTGAHIKDYQEATTAPWSTTAMAAADYQNANLAYYWKATGWQQVNVVVTNRFGIRCRAAERFLVERNATNTNRQAEDFYTWNHGSKVLVEHRGWHTVNVYIPCVSVGTPFYTFHHDFISRFQSWRREFGYGPVTAWNPGTPLPGGVANAHVFRAGIYNPLAHMLPTYLTGAGGVAMSPCFGAKKKADFATANAFWIEVQGPFHNWVHGGIGGDMNSVAAAPKDPIFWRFHKFIDGM